MIAVRTMIGVALMIEKRASYRHRVLKQGTIAFRGGGKIDCVVRNLSPGGARLEVATVNVAAARPDCSAALRDLFLSFISPHHITLATSNRDAHA